MEYRLDTTRPDNTFDAHRLQHFASSRQMPDRITGRIMHAYFSESLPVGDHTALTRLAPEFGIGENGAPAMLISDAYSKEVRADDSRATNSGITYRTVLRI